ncbi:MAG: thioesterase family protein [Acidimicrobiia bacterium]|nr:thioesterase family protein [Acidimicrobiia bacterium]
MSETWSDLTIDGQDRRSDHALLGLEHVGPGRASFVLTQPLARFDGKLFGGTAIAVAVALAEVTTARPALWTTVQFISGATSIGDRFECTTEVLADGKSAAQVRVRALVEGREIFCALGATAHHKADRIESAFIPFPSVLTPSEAPPFELPLPPALRPVAAKAHRNIEMRSAEPLARAEGSHPHLRLWTRVPGSVATPAVMAYLADMVPLSITRAAGRSGAGSSIDNTMRFSGAATAEWVLLDLAPSFASGGYGHGGLRVWSPEGELLATGSQTSSLLLFG